MDDAPQDPAAATDTSAPSTSIPEPPPPPVPSSDPSLADNAIDDAAAAEASQDLFKLPAVEALRLLSASVELLVRMTGDVPPTPPPRMPTDPQMSGLQAEKESIVRSHSEKNLARLRQQQQQKSSTTTTTTTTLPVTGKRPASDEVPNHGDSDNGGSKTKLQAYSAAMSARLSSQAGSTASEEPDTDEIDGVTLKHPQAALRSSPPITTTTTTTDPSLAPPPYIIVGSDAQPLNLQHGAITRKFYSKNEPPISIHGYLQRLHQFCPLSAAVYLAASLYIHRLAVEERAIPVTRRNAHRLVLAGLRVAAKALEDLAYPHGRFARVGGVSATELARLEISFCFLAGFDLVVREETLQAHWAVLREGGAARALRGMDAVPTLRLERKRRDVAA